MNNSVKFERIVTTDISPKRYLEEFLREVEPDRFEKVQSGELVTFTLPTRQNFTLSYLGVKPEKFDIVGNKLTVLMTSCVIVFIYTILDLKTKLEVSRMEIVSAL